MVPARNAYRILEDGKTVEMELTQGKVCLVDLEDMPKVAGRRWSATRKGDIYYAKTNRPRPEGGGSVYMHHVIFPGQLPVHVDHRDGNGLNNSKLNLRAADHTTNKFNRGATKRNTLGLKGVHYEKQSGVKKRIKRWCADINEDGKLRRIGRFHNPVAAGMAYDRRARELHGEFAKANFSTWVDPNQINHPVEGEAAIREMIGRYL